MAPASALSWLHELCWYVAAFEIVTSLLLFVWSCSYLLRLPTSKDVLVWTPLEAIAVVNVLRSAAAVAAPHYGRRLGLRARQLALPAAGVAAFVVSGAVLCGEAWVLLTSHTNHGLVTAERSEAYDVRAVSSTEMLSRLTVIVVNVLSSCVWFVSTQPAHPDEQDAAAQGAKPEVSSFTVGEDDPECGDSACAICLEDISSGCLAGRLPCGHVFHDACVRCWFERGHRGARCPMRCPGGEGGASPRGGSGDESGRDGDAEEDQPGDAPARGDTSPPPASTIGRAAAPEQPERSGEGCAPDDCVISV